MREPYHGYMMEQGAPDEPDADEPMTPEEIRARVDQIREDCLEDEHCACKDQEYLQWALDVIEDLLARTDCAACLEAERSAASGQDDFDRRPDETQEAWENRIRVRMLQREDHVFEEAMEEYRLAVLASAKERGLMPMPAVIEEVLSMKRLDWLIAKVGGRR